jgi:hypothetical protein
MSNLEQQIIDILTPFFGPQKSKNKLSNILKELNIKEGSLEGNNLQSVAEKMQESCKNLGPNTAGSVKEKILNLN